MRDTDPTSQTRAPAAIRNLPEVLSREDVARLLDTTTGDAPSARDVRDTCLLELLYGTGMRASEVCSLPLSAVREARAGMIRVTGKGGKDRLCPVGRQAGRCP